MADREKMSPVDTAWLRMDRPSNLMIILGVMVFSGRMNYRRLCRTVETRLVSCFRRFHQRVHQDASGAWWEDDPEFDIGNHVVRRALPAPAGKAELQALVSEMATEPLHAARPLWRLDVIEGYAGGTALVCRFHHCIADGIALVGVMLSLTDAAADAAPPKAPRQRSATPQDEDPWLALLDPVIEATTAALGMTKRFWAGYLETVKHPDLAMQLGRDGLAFAAELGKLLGMPADSPTRFKGATGPDKRVAWCEPIPLAEVKALGKALGCSVNDVLLTAVAGAFRSYLLQCGDPVDGVEVRALVPVNLRSEKDAGTLGNRFGLVALLLPIHEGNPFVRLFEIRRRMLQIKGSHQAPLTLLLLGIAGIAPKLVQDTLLDMLANKATAVMTNVPGPRQPLFIAGCRMEQIIFWVPQSGDIGIGVSILSYNDAVQFGMITDRHFIPNPDAVMPLFQGEFEKMLNALMLHDWRQPLDPIALERALDAELHSIDGGPAPADSDAATRGARRRRAGSKPSPAAAVASPGSPPTMRIPKRFRDL